MTPQNNPPNDTRIRYITATCSLDWILVAISSRGICAVALADQPETLITQLLTWFPQATLQTDDVHLQNILHTVIGHITTPDKQTNLPLDIFYGTPFQQRVWQALQTIPPGSTVNYNDIAQQIGAPKANRAVASACAANRVAILIPCHRVIRKNGKVSGYRWGVQRKTKLLEHEHSHTTTRMG